MKFLSAKCSGCGNCILTCPVQAIHCEDKAEIDWDNCVECHNCVRAAVCPSEAFEFSAPPWPRSLRATFSDPFFKHESTQHLGRGTEEVKTNDVTNLVTAGKIGLAVEAGRPGVGVRFREVEIITRTLARFPVEYPDKTPISSLIFRRETGELRPEILGERVLSVIVECSLPAGKLYEVLGELRKAMQEIDSTVFSIGVFCRGDELNFEHKPAEGYMVSPAGKNNLGLGRRCIG